MKVLKLIFVKKHLKTLYFKEFQLATEFIFHIAIQPLSSMLSIKTNTDLPPRRLNFQLLFETLDCLFSEEMLHIRAASNEKEYTIAPTLHQSEDLGNSNSAYIRCLHEKLFSKVTLPRAMFCLGKRKQTLLFYQSVHSA